MIEQKKKNKNKKEGEKKETNHVPLKPIKFNFDSKPRTFHNADFPRRNGLQLKTVSLDRKFETLTFYGGNQS